MTPTLLGRIQTRWVLLWTIGLAWVLVVGPFLPLAGPSVGAVWLAGFRTLLIVSIVGTAWEFVYHGLQQLRWDKDWPTLFGLLVGLNEGAVAYVLLRNGLPLAIPGLTVAPFVWQFGTVWLVVWAVSNGPIRVLFPRWRFAGGRFW